MNYFSRTIGLLMAFILAAMIIVVITIGTIVLSIIVPIAIVGFIIWFSYQIFKPDGQEDDDYKPP